VRDTELAELVDLAEADLAVALARAEEADARADEAESGLELERETQSELLAEREDLVRRLRYAEATLRERGDSPEPPPGEEPFIPDFCQDVVDYAGLEFGQIVLGPRVREGAEQLDEHAEPAWARKALRALEALQAYAEAKSSGADGSFWNFCEGAASLSVVPTSWIAMQESETTDQNPRFRALRTFEVDAVVDQSGTIYMPAHIKLEKGGNPSPRIHFHDDTDGSTSKVHVGWLGPHRDSKSKS
jgi:multidrug efflux pump subunit AcrA (membrane-fusion protein)